MSPSASSTTQPFQTGVVLNLQDGEAGHQPTLVKVPADKWFVIECIGVNAFAQPGQIFVIALEVTTSRHLGTYPIVLPGNSTIADPAFSARSFGSQLVRLYAAPNSEVMLPISRNNAQGSARVFVDISGFLLDA
jgi:hypothetical protein